MKSKISIMNASVVHNIKHCEAEYTDIMIRELDFKNSSEYLSPSLLVKSPTSDSTRMSVLNKAAETHGNVHLRMNANLIGFKGMGHDDEMDSFFDLEPTSIKIASVYFWMPVEPKEDGRLSHTYDVGDEIELHAILDEPDIYEEVSEKRSNQKDGQRSSQKHRP